MGFISKRTVFVLLTMLLSAILIVGCGENSGNTNQTGTNSENNEGENATEASENTTNDSSASNESSDVSEEQGPPEELSIFMQIKDPSQSMDLWAIHYVEEKLNLKLNITLLPDGDKGDKALNVKLASGERPDIIQFTSNDTEINLLDSNMLEPLTPYFDQYTDLYNSRPEVQWKAIKNSDGNAYAVPTRSDPYQFNLLYRQDWLDNLGLEVPTNLDEYLEVARAMTHDDPDGNGKDDTYAFAGRKDRLSFFDYIFSAFGVYPSEDLLKDGKLVNGGIQPESKQALIYIHQMYEEGLIDPEFVTDNGSRWKDKFAISTFGAATGKVWVLNEHDSYYEKFKANNPEGSWTLGPLLQGPEGITPLGYRTGGSYRGPLRTAILSTSEHKEAALKLLNWLGSPEGNIFFWAGLEGEHYEVNEDGIIVNTISPQEADKLGIKVLKLTQYDIPNYKISKEFQKIHQSMVDQAWIPPTSGMMNNKSYATTGADLNDYIITQYYKMITGQIPIDSGWDDFLAGMKDREIDQRMADLNAQYTEWKKYAK